LMQQGEKEEHDDDKSGIKVSFSLHDAVLVCLIWS
jgi:hypothetical protein